MTGPWYLYLDESGDLGFDPEKKGRSNYFTICVLAISTVTRNQSIASAVRKTVRRKLTPRRKRKRSVAEFKGSSTSLEIKEYFFRQVTGAHFGIYAVTLNKERLYPQLQGRKERTYNYLARLLLDQIPFPDATETVHLVLDKRKSRPEIREFNTYISRELEECLQPNVRLRITHEDSRANPCLQAVDAFCYGFFRKYERQDEAWYNVFRGKIRYETLYLPPKKS